MTGSGRTVAAIALATGAIALSGCTSSGSSSTASSAPNTTAGSSSSAPPSSAASSTAASSASSAGLSGTWSGQYSGAFHGTFTLTWQQSGAKLDGTIKLSTAPADIPLHGTVSGNSIKFGTVGTSAVTYTGSVNGSSMSGNYSVGGASGGTWSAKKTA